MVRTIDRLLSRTLLQQVKAPPKLGAVAPYESAFMQKLPPQGGCAFWAVALTLQLLHLQFA